MVHFYIDTDSGFNPTNLSVQGCPASTVLEDTFQFVQPEDTYKILRNLRPQCFYLIRALSSLEKAVRHCLAIFFNSSPREMKVFVS